MSINELQTEILIVGGGLGGVAAALAALRLGREVILSEETPWLGGQMTAQAVPPDEHPWIEETGCTRSYRALREGIRDYYRRFYPMIQEVKADPAFNPGQGNVSKLCHEPRLSLAVIEAMLAPYRASAQLQVFLRCQPISAQVDGDRVLSVTLQDLDTDQLYVISAPYVLDATELGDLLPMASTENVLGAESQAQTGEPHALEGDPDPLEQQPFSWCFALDYHEAEDHTIEKPEQYDFWRDYQASYWPDKMLSWTCPNPETLETVTRPLFRGMRQAKDGDDLWHFRRIFYNGHYLPGAYLSDIVVVNWPQIDYWLSPLVGVEPDVAAHNLYMARQLSLSMLYWMQTEAPHMVSGFQVKYGYPGLRLRGDITGSSHAPGEGLALAPYIRESRRIQAEFTVLEEHVGVAARGAAARGDRQGAQEFPDTVGVGSYRIDLHPTYLRNYVDIDSWPFQIPLGALIPIRMENLLPACKNLGVTHITNGCYRLHPVEWNIGEAAGALAAWCLEKELAPRQVRNTPAHLSDFQQLLSEKLGFQLHWEEEIRLTPRKKVDPLGI